MKFQHCIGLFLALTTVAAAAKPRDPVDVDRSGGTDHPLVSRYAGSTLYQYGSASFGSVSMLEPNNGKAAATTYQGKVANKMYFGPPGVSSVEVFRNFQIALRNAGYTTVYQCEERVCNDEKARTKMINWPFRSIWANDGKSNGYLIGFFRTSSGFRYLHVKKDGPAGPTHIHVATRDGATEGEAAGRVQQLVQIVEPAGIELGKVTVDAKAINESIRSTGRIALYGILFDTNEAVLKPESRETLAEMAKALQDEKALNVYIVGHTDNVGSLDANMALSKRRAQAVVDALTAQYGIAKPRLAAYGVGSLAPSSQNTIEEGRAKNRRVEMVAR